MWLEMVGIPKTSIALHKQFLFFWTSGSGAVHLNINQ